MLSNVSHLEIQTPIITAVVKPIKSFSVVPNQIILDQETQFTERR
jgi:hypothetical protein